MLLDQICIDTDHGSLDKKNDSCSMYEIYPNECGRWDNIIFVAESMCCACGGGTRGRYTKLLLYILSFDKWKISDTSNEIMNKFVYLYFNYNWLAHCESTEGEYCGRETSANFTDHGMCCDGVKCKREPNDDVGKCQKGNTRSFLFC